MLGGKVRRRDPDTERWVNRECPGVQLLWADLVLLQCRSAEEIGATQCFLGTDHGGSASSRALSFRRWKWPGSAAVSNAGEHSWLGERALHVRGHAKRRPLGLRWHMASCAAGVGYECWSRGAQGRR